MSAAVGLAACGGDDDDEGSATATTASATFCTGYVDYKTLGNRRDGLDTPEQIAKRSEDLAAGARAVAAAAPESVKSARRQGQGHGLGHVTTHGIAARLMAFQASTAPDVSRARPAPHR